MASALEPQTLEHQNQVENHRTLNTKPWAKSISRLKTPRRWKPQANLEARKPPITPSLKPLNLDLKMLNPSLKPAKINLKLNHKQMLNDNPNI